MREEDTPPHEIDIGSVEFIVGKIDEIQAKNSKEYLKNLLFGYTETALDPREGTSCAFLLNGRLHVLVLTDDRRYMLRDLMTGLDPRDPLDKATKYARLDPYCPVTLSDVVIREFDAELLDRREYPSPVDRLVQQFHIDQMQQLFKKGAKNGQKE